MKVFDTSFLRDTWNLRVESGPKTDVDSTSVLRRISRKPLYWTKLKRPFDGTWGGRPLTVVLHISPTNPYLIIYKLTLLNKLKAGLKEARFFNGINLFIIAKTNQCDHNLFNLLTI